MESLISTRKIRMDSQFLLNPTFIHSAFLILFDVNFQNTIVYNRYSNISSISPSKIKFKCFHDTSYQKKGSSLSGHQSPPQSIWAGPTKSTRLSGQLEAEI